jgi:hypothetical protein
MINPFKSKKGLGRGLSSLIGDSEKINDKKNVSISSLVRNKYQPRKKFDEVSLEELTNSIRERGIIQPIIVRPSSDEENKFEIIAGERRWQAIISNLFSSSEDGLTMMGWIIPRSLIELVNSSKLTSSNFFLG